ncbi:Protein of unknown function, partial [Cotesia congregata]
RRENLNVLERVRKKTSGRWLRDRGGRIGPSCVRWFLFAFFKCLCRPQNCGVFHCTNSASKLSTHPAIASSFLV